MSEPASLVPDPDEGDWEVVDGLWIATRSGLIRQGTCCGSACRNCPYVGTELEHPERGRQSD